MLWVKQTFFPKTKKNDFTKKNSHLCTLLKSCYPILKLPHPQATPSSSYPILKLPHPQAAPSSSYPILKHYIFYQHHCCQYTSLIYYNFQSSTDNQFNSRTQQTPYHGESSRQYEADHGFRPYGTGSHNQAVFDSHTNNIPLTVLQNQLTTPSTPKAKHPQYADEYLRLETFRVPGIALPRGQNIEILARAGFFHIGEQSSSNHCLEHNAYFF